MGFFGDIAKAEDAAGETVAKAADDTGKGIMDSPIGSEINAQARNYKQQAAEDSGDGSSETPAEITADAAEDSIDAIGEDP